MQITLVLPHSEGGEGHVKLHMEQGAVPLLLYPRPPMSSPPPPQGRRSPPTLGGRSPNDPPPPRGVDTTLNKPFTSAYSAEFMASHVMHTIQISRILNAQHPLISAVMHNFSSTTFVRDGSILFTMRRRALDNSQHMLLCGTDIAYNSALREHFQRSEECKGSEQRRWHNPVQYGTNTFFLELGSDGPPPPPPRGGDGQGGGGGWTWGGEGNNPPCPTNTVSNAYFRSDRFFGQDFSACFQVRVQHVCM